MLGSGLRTLAVQPLWRRWTLASFLARLPMTMTLIALLLAGREATGSTAVGALLAGTATFTSGFASTWRGRRLDRFELRSGLQRACLITAAVLATLAAFVAFGAPTWTLFALAFLLGVASAAITGGYRALLVPVVPDVDLPRANTMEAVFVEVAFVSGPAVAGLLALWVGPSGALAAMALSAVSAALVTRGLPRLDPPAEVSSAVAPWRLPAARPVFVLAIALGVCFGLFEASVTARAEQLGLSAAAGGPLLALTAFGSVLGGLIATGRPDWLSRAALKAVGLLTVLAVLLVPVALAGSPLLLGAALLLAGFPIAPLSALGTLVLQRAVPAGRQAEGFAVYTASILLGAGTGNALAGALLGPYGPSASVLAAAAMPAVAAVAVIVGSGIAVRRRSRAVDAPAGGSVGAPMLRR